MLFGTMEMDLAALQEFFRVLSRERIRLTLHEQGFVESPEGVQVYAESAPANHHPRKRDPIKVVIMSEDPPRFEWTQSPEEWAETADLLDGLAESAVPAHQYLSRYPDDAVTIVVSRGEFDHRLPST
jgi:hypothetical protein